MLSTRASSSFNKEGTLSMVCVSSAMVGSIAGKRGNREAAEYAKENEEEGPTDYTD